jgi:hypothetical protein
VTGNNTGIGNFDTQQTLSDPIYYPFGDKYVTGYSASKIVNRDLKWETSTEYNAGIDFGFLGGRINGSIDIYQKTSKDLLFQVPLPLESGGGTMVTNIGSVRNRGIEIALTTVNVETKDWHWETVFTFAANNNKVREINGTGDRVLNGTNPLNNWFIGYSVNNTYAYEWGGIVSDRDMTVPDNLAAKNAGLTPGSTMKEYDYFYKVYGLTEGQPWVVDQNGDGKIDSQDEVELGRWSAKFTGGLNLTLKYKNFTLFTMLTGQFGGNALKNDTYNWVYDERKYSDVVLGAWTAEKYANGESISYPRLTTQGGNNNFRASDYWMYSTDRVDLQRVQLTYDFDKKIFGANSIVKGLQVYVNGSSLLTISGEREQMERNVGSAPQTRSFTLGAKVQF